MFGASIADARLMHEPAYYDILWSILGILCLVAVGVILFLIFFSTRKKEIKTIASLHAESPATIGIEKLRQKYLKMIDETLQKFSNRTIKASEAHQEFSLILRRFFAELYGFNADALTLSDFKKSRYKNLTALIEHYYPDEFDMLEKGSVSDSAERARALIMSATKEGDA